MDVLGSLHVQRLRLEIRICQQMHSLARPAGHSPADSGLNTGILSQFWGLEVHDEGVGRFGFSWGLLTGSSRDRCIYAVARFSFYKDISQIHRGPPHSLIWPQSSLPRPHLRSRRG